MAFIPATNTAEVEIRGTLAGQQTENTLFYLFTSAIDTSDLQALVDDIGHFIHDDMLGYFPNDWVGREVYAKDLTSAVGAQATNTEISGVSGTGGVAAPNNVSIALQRSSGLAGRSARGRIYWQGIPTAQIDATNSVDGAFTTAILAALEDIDDLARSLDWVPVIVSYFEGGLPRAAATLFEIVLWKVTDNVIDSMRERLPGRGK